MTLTARAVDFLTVVSRGIGQVMLQENALAGVLFLAAVAVSSPSAAVAMLLGAACGTATAGALRIEPARVSSGLHGFNGALAGIALTTFLPNTSSTWLLVVAGAAATVPVMRMGEALLGRIGVPVLTAPFLVVTFTVLFIHPQYGELSGTAGAVHAIGFPSALKAALLGLSQVFLQESIAVGVIIAIGLFAASRGAMISAIVGSVMGLATGYMMGAADSDLAAGLLGFNGALVAVALAGSFSLSTLGRFVLIAAASSFSAVFQLLAGHSFAAAGIPILTFPFVATVWIFVFAGNAVRRLFWRESTPSAE